MSTGKRLAKRSIIGTRVCAPGDDGKYYSGAISAVDTPSSSGQPDSQNGALSITPQTRYRVRFDPAPAGSRAPPDDGTEYLDRDLIGPGFSNVCGAKLVAGQKVFLTHNGREVQGSVLDHREHQDEVEVVIHSNNKDVQQLCKRIDEVRLLESRKSARLADSDTDFARLADVGSDRKRTASQANIDRPDSSNSPCHINNRSPWKPRRRTHSEQSSVSGNSDNAAVPTTTTRTYKGTGSGNNNEPNNATTTTVFYVGDCHPYALHVRNRPQAQQPTAKARNGSHGSSDGEEQQAAQALMTLSSPGKTSPKAAEALVTLSTSPAKPPKVADYRCTRYLMSAIEESSSSGNSNASDSDNNSWRSDTPSLRSAEEYYNAMQLHHRHHHHRPSSSAPNSPKDEGIVPDLVYPHHFNKKRRFVNARDADEEDERAKYVTSKPTKARRDEFVQTTKAKRGRPPTYRRRSPSPLPMVHEDDEDEDEVSDDDDDDDDEDSNDPFGYGTSDGYGSDSGKMYICTWSAGNGEPPCGVTGTFNLVANHFTQRHNDKDEDMDFYVLEESEFRHYDYKVVRNVETKPTECGLPTKSHWDMVKPMSADPEYQMQLHRSQMAAHSAAAAQAAHAVVSGGREIIYLENGSLSPHDDALTRETMSPPRPANKPIKARASQQQRQFIINNINHHHNNNNNNNANANNNNHHMTKVNLVHINLGKMPQTTRRGRSDVKKCRKVYGMSHKELWCTQCKWKKACQRFHVPQPGAPQGAAATTATEISIAEHVNPR